MNNLKVILVLIILTTSISFAKDNDSIGKTVYDNACAACHAPKYSKAIKAPAAFDNKVWATRLSDAKKKSGAGKRYKTPYDYLLHQIHIGKGLMHHHGLCLESKLPKSYCTDSAYIAAIKYMTGKK